MKAIVQNMKRGPHGDTVVLVAAAVLVMTVSLAIGLLYPPVWRVAVSLSLIALGATGALMMLVLARFRTQVADVYSAVALHAGLRAADWQIPDLFLDGAAANPSLQYFNFKVLRLLKPQRVLELGSGQTTKLLSAYAAANPEARVLTLEQDESWWARQRATIVHDFRHRALVDTRVVVPAAGLDIATRWYADVPELRQEKFNYILVDGPYTGTPGQASVPYSRSGVLAYLPALLADPFVVVFDDAERPGETQTVEAFQAMLRAASIAHHRFSLDGVKIQVVFCSASLGFLRSV